MEPGDGPPSLEYASEGAPPPLEYAASMSGEIPSVLEPAPASWLPQGAESFVANVKVHDEANQLAHYVGLERGTLVTR